MRLSVFLLLALLMVANVEGSGFWENVFDAVKDGFAFIGKVGTNFGDSFSHNLQFRRDFWEYSRPLI